MDAITFNIYATYIVPPTVLIPIALALINYRYLTNPLKVIFGFLVFSGLINLASLIVISYKHPNTGMIHIYTIFEFIFFSLFYSAFFGKKQQDIIKVLMVGFTVLCIVNYLFIQNKIEFNTYTRPLGAIIIIIYSMLFIFRQQNDEQSWGSNKYNWINAGTLLYFASCLFMFIFSNYLLIAGRSFNRVVWTIHDTILIFEYILFAIGFYKCKTQPTISTY